MWIGKDTMRKRKVVFMGGMYYIRLSKSDIKDLKLEVGDEVDIEDLVIIKEKESKKK